MYQHLHFLKILCFREEPREQSKAAARIFRVFIESTSTRARAQRETLIESIPSHTVNTRPDTHTPTFHHPLPHSRAHASYPLFHNSTELREDPREQSNAAARIFRVFLEPIDSHPRSERDTHILKAFPHTSNARKHHLGFSHTHLLTPIHNHPFSTELREDPREQSKAAARMFQVYLEHISSQPRSERDTHRKHSLAHSQHTPRHPQ